MKTNYYPNRQLEPISATAAIIAGAGTAGQGINAFAQGKMNRKTRQWNEKMYARQREDALADWARTNEYNTPLQQMARLKQAGLNPNLVYDKGADNTSAMVRGTEAKSWDPKAPAFDLGQIANQYLGSQQRTQSMELTQEEIEGKRLDNIYKDLNNTMMAEKLSFNKETIALKLDQLREDILSKRAGTAYTYGENERKWQVHDIMKKPNYEAKLAEIARINSQNLTDQYSRNMMMVQSDKLKAETNLLKLTTPQQVELNKLLQDEKNLNNILIGEKTTTEEFERRLKAAYFTSDQISKILDLVIPKGNRGIPTRKMNYRYGK